MNHIMFSFLKPQICFGESNGGGGDGGGGGEGSASSGTAGADVTATATGATQFGVDYGDDDNDQRREDSFENLYNQIPIPTDSEINFDRAGPYPASSFGQVVLPQAVTNQLGGDTSYDNITGTDAYQLNRISPQNIDANILNPPPPPESDIVESISIREGPDSIMAPFNDPIGGGLDAGPFDVFGQDIYKPTPPVTYNSELDNSNYNEFVDTARYSGNESGTYPEAGSMDSIASNFNDEIPNDFANFTTPGNDSGTISNTNSIASNFYDDNYFQPDPINDILAGEEFTTSAANVPPAPPGDEMDFVPRQGPVQAAPPAPPGDEMDFVDRQGPSPMTGFFEGDVDSGTEMDLSSPDANFYDEIPNDFSNFLTPGNDSGMEMDLSSPDANFYDETANPQFLSGMDGPSPTQLETPQFFAGMDGPQGIGSVSMERDLLGKPAPDAMSAGQAGALEDSLNMEIIADGQGQAIRGNENQELFKELGISNPLSLSDQPYNFDQIQNRRYGGFDTAPYEISKLALGELNEQVDIDQGFTSIPTEKEINNNKSEIKFINSNDNPTVINPEGFTSESLLASAYEKANSGRTSELTTAEQAVLVGQRGQQLNPAEMTQLAQVYENSGKIPMTKEFQDSIIESMRDPESISETIGGKRNTRGATDAEIEAYKKANPIGQDINPNWKPFEELEGWEKAGRAIENSIKFLIKNATSGIIDFDKMNKNFSDKYLSAYQDPGQTGGQFLYGSETNDDITNDENFDRLVELSGTERGAEPILEGVMGSDGELVRGYDRYKNTIDGVEKVIDEGLQDDINVCPPGFYYDRVVESCMPIESLTDDTEAGDGPPNTIRPRPPIIPPNPDPTRPPVSQPISGGVTIRKPKFFRDGGSVTPNIDSFFSGMGR